MPSWIQTHNGLGDPVCGASRVVLLAAHVIEDHRKCDRGATVARGHVTAESNGVIEGTGLGSDAPGRVVDLYRAVLIEAASPQDLYAYLDEGVLRRLWALLWLPAQLRSAWEQRFPVLAEISRITAAA